MKKEKLKTQVEVFICNHSRDGDEACAEKGAQKLHTGFIELMRFIKNNRVDGGQQLREFQVAAFDQHAKVLQRSWLDGDGAVR